MFITFPSCDLSSHCCRFSHPTIFRNNLYIYPNLLVSQSSLHSLMFSCDHSLSSLAYIFLISFLTLLIISLSSSTSSFTLSYMSLPLFALLTSILEFLNLIASSTSRFILPYSSSWPIVQGFFTTLLTCKLLLQL